MSPVRRSPPFDGGLGNANAGAKLGLRTASGLVIFKTRKNINLFARSEPRELERRSEGLCAKLRDSQQVVLSDWTISVLLRCTTKSSNLLISASTVTFCEEDSE